MKTKLIFSTETSELEHWIDFPIIPRIKEWIRVSDFLSINELNHLKQSALCWSGEKGTIDAVEHRYNPEGFFTELLVWCED